MSAFCSLEGDAAPSGNPNVNPQLHHPTTCPDNLFLLRNQENHFKRFELWQNNNPNNAIPNMFPNVTASSSRFFFPMVGSEGGGGIGGEGGEKSCRDCGNQAKKECTYMRTCCKGRGFQCNTHVKSTWVPAEKRRQKREMLEFSAAKRRRESDDTASGSKECYGNNITGCKSGKYPGEVELLASLRRVRVRSIDELEEHIAYQTTVIIGGHVFKGILYNQGLQNQ